MDLGNSTLNLTLPWASPCSPIIVLLDQLLLDVDVCILTGLGTWTSLFLKCPETSHPCTPCTLFINSGPWPPPDWVCSWLEQSPIYPKQFSTSCSFNDTHWCTQRSGNRCSVWAGQVLPSWPLPGSRNTHLFPTMIVKFFRKDWLILPSSRLGVGEVHCQNHTNSPLWTWQSLPLNQCGKLPKRTCTPLGYVFLCDFLCD